MSTLVSTALIRHRQVYGARTVLWPAFLPACSLLTACHTGVSVHRIWFSFSLKNMSWLFISVRCGDWIQNLVYSSKCFINKVYHFILFWGWVTLNCSSLVFILLPPSLGKQIHVCALYMTERPFSKWLYEIPLRDKLWFLFFTNSYLIDRHLETLQFLKNILKETGLTPERYSCSQCMCTIHTHTKPHTCKQHHIRCYYTQSCTHTGTGTDSHTESFH